MTEKISNAEIIRFIDEQDLLKLDDRIKIIEMVSDYFGDKVDGNDVNKILMDVFGR